MAAPVACAGAGAGTADRGAAVVEVVLVTVLLTVLFVALLQLVLVLHVRNTLTDCAAEGARYGALADRDPAAGARRATELVTADLSARYATDVSAGFERVDGVDTVVVVIRAPLPVVGLIGPRRVLTVRGHAVAEVP